MRCCQKLNAVMMCDLALFGLLFANTATASDGAIVGFVRGPGGVALSSVTITVTDPLGSLAASVVSGAGGGFKVAGLDTGRYRVEARLEGFFAEPTPEISVAQGRPVRVELELKLATFHDSMEVDSVLPPTSLEAATVRESPARDVGEAMARLPGVWKVRKGGIANDIVVKGYSQDDITVLIDGARVAGACPNRMDPPAFHLDFAELDRVEMTPTSGQMAAQGGLGGLVNIVTRKPGPDLHADLFLAAGSWNMVNPSATVSWGNDRFAALGGFSHRSSEPYADGSGRLLTEMANYTGAASGVDAYNISSGWARLYWAPVASHEINLSYARQDAGGVLYPALMMDAVTDDTDRFVVGYRYNREGGGFRALGATVYGTRVNHWMVDSLRATATGSPRGWSMGTQAGTEIFGATVDAELGTLTLGLEAYSRNWNVWTELAGMNYMRQPSLPNADMNVAGLSVRWVRGLSQRTRLELGGRLDWVSTAADADLANTGLYYAFHGVTSTSTNDVEPSVSAQVVHAAGPNLTLNGGLSRTVRFPDPRERYFGLRRMGADWVGNPDLDPPAATRAELGMTWSAGGGMLGVGVWVDAVNGFITVYNQQKINDVPGVMNSMAQSYANVDATIRGFAIEASKALSSRLFLAGDVAYVRGTQEPIPGLGIFSTNLPEMPPVTGRLSLRWQNRWIYAEIEGVGAGSQNDVNTDLKESPTPSWGVVNLKGGYTSGSWRVQLVLGNVFDETYHENFSYLRNPFRAGFVVNEPGRNLSLSLGWTY
jgi:iron complex outermembrane receptor protein